ncbi:MAG: hypothetical protein ABL901_09095 [Hyphomicrobiaceae bacterium]
MTIEFDALLKVLSLAVSVGGALYAWMASRDKATAVQIRELELRFGLLESRAVKSELETQAQVQRIDAQLKNVPDKEAIHKLELGMQEVRGAVDQMKDQWKDQLTQMQRSFQRLEDFLLDARTQPAQSAPAQTRRRASK